MCTRLRLRSARLPTVRCSSVRGPALRCPSVVFVTADPSSRRAQFLFCPEICARRNFSVGYSRSRLFEFRYSTAVASRFSPAQFARPLTYFTSSHLSTHLAHPVRDVTLFWCMRRDSPYLATLRRRHAGMLRQQCRFRSAVLAARPRRPALRIGCFDRSSRASSSSRRRSAHGAKRPTPAGLSGSIVSSRHGRSPVAARATASFTGARICTSLG